MYSMQYLMIYNIILAQGVVFPALSAAAISWVPLPERARFISFAVQGWYYPTHKTNPQIFFSSPSPAFSQHFRP